MKKFALLLFILPLVSLAQSPTPTSYPSGTYYNYPSHTPTPSPTYNPTPYPTSYLTPTPSGRPTPTVTVTPTVTPSATPTVRPTPTPFKDKKPPVVSVTPNAGKTVSGVVTFTIKATDNVAVASLTLNLHSSSILKTIKTVGGTTKTITWDTTTEANGPVRLDLQAIDTAGNITDTGIYLNIKNSRRVPDSGLAVPASNTLPGLSPTAQFSPIPKSIVAAAAPSVNYYADIYTQAAGPWSYSLDDNGGEILFNPEPLYGNVEKWTNGATSSIVELPLGITYFLDNVQQGDEITFKNVLPGFRVTHGNSTPYFPYNLDTTSLPEGSLHNIKMVARFAGETYTKVFTNLKIVHHYPQVAVNECYRITAPGTYTLTPAIIGDPTNFCVAMYSISDVTLDCANLPFSTPLGYYVRGLQVSSVNNFTIKNCNIKNATGYSMDLNYATNGQMINNTFGDAAVPDQNFVIIQSNDGLTFDNNTFNAVVDSVWDRNITIKNSNLTTPKYTRTDGGQYAPLRIYGGQNWLIKNNILGNTSKQYNWFAGYANGNSNLINFDTNTMNGFLVLENTSSSTVQNNTITSVLGDNRLDTNCCGINENSGVGNKFLNNTIDGRATGGLHIGFARGFDIRGEISGTVTGNIINNVWISGIIATGVLTNTTICNNIINGVSVCTTGGVTTPSITSSINPIVTRVGKPFSYQITASNSPTSFSATGLPAGLVLNTATGLIGASTTLASGTSTVTIGATNAGGTGTSTLKIFSTFASDGTQNGKVDIYDYSLLIQNFNFLGVGNPSDANNDGKVDIYDYSVLIQQFNSIIP